MFCSVLTAIMVKSEKSCGCFGMGLSLDGLGGEVEVPCQISTGTLLSLS
jgi:hypothetical protein